MARRKKNRWFSKPWWFRHSIYLGVFLFALCVFYGVENFRARKAWEQHIGAEGNHVHEEDRFQPPPSPAAHPTFETSAFLTDAIKQYSLGKSTIDLSALPDFVNNAGRCVDRSGKVLQSELYFENCFPSSSPALSRKAAATRFLELSERWTPQLDKFNEAAALPPGPALMPASDSLTDYFAVLSRFASVTEIKYTAELVHNCAHAHLIVGNAQTALDFALSSGKICDNLAHRSTLIGGTLATALTVTYRGLVWDGLNRQAWDLAQLQLLADVTEKLQPAAWAQRAFLAERLRILPMLENFDSSPIQQYRLNREFGYLNLVSNRTIAALPQSLKEFPGIADSALFALLPRGWARGNCLYACRSFDNQIQILGEEDPDIRKQLISDSDKHSSEPSSPYTFLCQIHLIGNSAYARGAWEFEPRIRLMRLGIALEIHLLKTGSYPKNLADLSDQITAGVPVDPWSGNPFLYRMENSRPLIYSIGPNQSDDGGTDGQSPKDDDVIWHYPLNPGAP